MLQEKDGLLRFLWSFYDSLKQCLDLGLRRDLVAQRHRSVHAPEQSRPRGQQGEHIVWCARKGMQRAETVRRLSLFLCLCRLLLTPRPPNLHEKSCTRACACVDRTATNEREVAARYASDTVHGVD